MHARALGAALAATALLLVTACQSGAPSGEDTARSRHRQQAQLDSSSQAVRSFTFGAAGDMGATKQTAASLRALDRSNARFFVALGDLDYDMTPSDAAWCRYVKNRLPNKGAKFPFELLVGNHESDGGGDGRIRNFVACLPDRLRSAGKYGTQYAFTFPRTNPYAKLIMTAPGLKVDGHSYTYAPGTADRKWLVRQIDSARANGIKWVIVGMHSMCLSTGTDHPGCASGHTVHDLVLGKKVDLLLGGHNHIYERSKQLALSAACPRIPADTYDPACVVGSGADGAYRKGRGTVQITSGRFGARPAGLSRQDPDAPYFVKLASGTTGWVKYTVTPTRLVGTYVNTSGTLQDTFTIR